MPPDPEPVTVTILLNDADSASHRIERLLPLVYDQLRAAAQICLGGERAGHTLQATALVHEAYLRLVGDRKIPWANRAHFYTAAAEAMRRILLDHARSRGRDKRGGGRERLELSDVAALVDSDPETILALDKALDRLEGGHPQAASIVRLRFYAGLTVDQAASALGLSPRQVDREWAFARAWLYRTVREILA